jgi:L-threonylcarbamoyladenylate synthase
MITKTLPTDEPELEEQAVREAVKLLAAGEIVALPTETVYGLAANALNAEAVAKIFAAKERPSFDPLIVHLPGRKALSTVAHVPADIASVIDDITSKLWPGPLTIVLPKTDAVPDIVTAGLPTVAVRLSSDPIFSAIARNLGKPIAAPSANRFGRISPTSASAVQAELDGRIPLIVDAGGSPCGVESTIIKVEIDAEKGRPHITILRPGPVTKDDLRPFGKVIVAKESKAKPDVPGQLPSHYAPTTPMRLLEKPSDFTPDEDKRYALLSYRGEPKDGYLDLCDWEEVLILSPGSGKVSEAAVRLFYAMRQLDALGVDEIIAEPVNDFGIGLAIMDRLRRASAR